MIQIPSKNIVVQGSCSIRLEDWCSDGKLPEGSRWIGNSIFAPITSGDVKWPRDTIYTPGVYLEIADRRLQSLAAIWLWRPAATQGVDPQLMRMHSVVQVLTLGFGQGEDRGGGHQ